MKRIERLLGIIAVSLFVIGVLFKTLHWPGASIIHSIAALLFNFGYLPLQLIRERRETESGLSRFYIIFRFITLFLVMFAFLFKIQHWPGSGILLFLSTYMIPLFILLYFYVRIKGKGQIPFQWSDLFLTVIAYVIYTFVNQMLVSPQVVEGYVIMEEQNSKINAGLRTANQIIYSSLDSLSETENQEIIASIKELKDLCEGLYENNQSFRKEFISGFYTHPLGEDFDLVTAERALLSSTLQSTRFFMEQGKGEQLHAELDSFVKAIASIHRKHNLPANLVTNGFDTEDFTNRWGEIQSWEEHLFHDMPVAYILATLSWLDQMLLLAERSTLNQLTILLDNEEVTNVLQQVATTESKLAMDLKENEILRIRQEKELQRIQLQQSHAELNQRNSVTALAFAGIVFVLILFFISTRAYVLKQKDNKLLGTRNEEILAQRDEIEAQRDEIEAQRNMVSLQKEQIERTHNEISSSIDYAMRLQNAMLPTKELLEHHFADHLIFFRPKQKVSGDFYWWDQIESKLVIAVADCTGHGVPGAFMSMLGASLLKEVVRKEGITRPGAILDRLRKEVIFALNQTGDKSEQKDGMDMALITIHTESLKCEFAGANNPLYLVRQGELSEYKGESMPLSHYERMDSFSTQEIKLQKGDQLYLSSDGYADQFGGKHRKKFKYKAFQELLAVNSEKSMQEQNRILLDTILDWTGDNEQIDDMVVVGIRI
jgi:serine phosphatase RsbU (regulator of sigma subunit)